VDTALEAARSRNSKRLPYCCLSILDRPPCVNGTPGPSTTLPSARDPRAKRLENLATDAVGVVVGGAKLPKRSKTTEFTVSPGMRGLYSMTLGNNDCKVTLYYTMTTQLKPA
jgi:hypothetical protein